MPYIAPGYIAPGYFVGDDGGPWIDGIPEPVVALTPEEEFLRWLKSETSLRCLLVEATYRDMDTGVTGVEYMASMAFTSEPGDLPSNQVYRAVVNIIPQFDQSLSDVLIGRTTANLGRIEVDATEARTDAWIFSRDWVGRSLKLYIGDPAWPKSLFRLIWNGVTADVSLADTNTLVFQARDQQHLLNQPLAVTKLTTGPNAGSPSPLCFGACTNITPVLIDDATHTYRVHDGQVQAIAAVRVAGVTLTPGTDYAPDAANGTFALAAAPTGQVTCDVRGAVVDGVYLQTAAQLLLHLATERGAFPAANIDTDSFDAFAALCPQFLGLFQGPQTVNVYQLMDSIITSVGGFYAVSREGNLYADRFDFDGESVLTLLPEDLAEHGLLLDMAYPPVRQVSLGAARNWTPQPTVDAAVGETDRGAVSTEYAVATFENPNAGDYGKVTDDGLVGTLLTSPLAAAAEAERQVGLWGQRRYRFKVACFTTPALVNLGDVVTIKHSRYGLAEGRTGVVVNISDRPSKKRFDLSVLM